MGITLTAGIYYGVEIDIEIGTEIENNLYNVLSQRNDPFAENKYNLISIKTIGYCENNTTKTILYMHDFYQEINEIDFYAEVIEDKDTTKFEEQLNILLSDFNLEQKIPKRFLAIEY